MRRTEEAAVPEVTTLMGDGLERSQSDTHGGSYKLVATTPDPNAECSQVRIPALTLLSISLSCLCSAYSGQVIDSQEEGQDEPYDRWASGQFGNVSSSAFSSQ